MVGVSPQVSQRGRKGCNETPFTKSKRGMLMAFPADDTF